MKNHIAFIFFISVSICWLSSCVKNTAHSILGLESKETTSYDITIADIQEYLFVKKGLSLTKSMDVRVDPIIDKGDTIFYLINYQEGWELLSSDRRTPRVFAMCERGHIDADSFRNENPALKTIYDLFVGNILHLKKHPFPSTDNDYCNNSWDDVFPSDRSLDWQLIDSVVLSESDTVQTHLTQTRWGQGRQVQWNCRMPYTDYTLSTRCLAGCTPVAVAQILYYLHYAIGVPEYSYGESSTNAFIPNNQNYLVLQPNDVVFDSSSYSSQVWDNMPLTRFSYGSFPTVSTLLLEVGLRLDAKYYSGYTDASIYYLPSRLSQYYSITATHSSSVDFDVVSSQIIHNHLPVIMCIAHYSIDDTLEGHTVVVDACKEHYQTAFNTYRRLEPAPFPLEPYYVYKQEVVTTVTSRYIGINWGWDGSYMEEGEDVIWFNTDVISWLVNYSLYTVLVSMVYGFSAI